MIIYNSTKVTDRTFEVLGMILTFLTFGFGFWFSYDVFFRYEDWINMRRFYKYLKGKSIVNIKRYVIEDSTKGYIDILLRKDLKLSINRGWSLWDENNKNNNIGNLVIQDNPLCFLTRSLNNKIITEINRIIFDYYDSIPGMVKYNCIYYFPDTSRNITTFCRNDRCIRSINIRFDSETCYCISGNIYVDWSKNIMFSEKIKSLTR